MANLNKTMVSIETIYKNKMLMYKNKVNNAILINNDEYYKYKAKGYKYLTKYFKGIISAKRQTSNIDNITMTILRKKRNIHYIYNVYNKLNGRWRRHNSSKKIKKSDPNDDWGIYAVKWW